MQQLVPLRPERKETGEEEFWQTQTPVHMETERGQRLTSHMVMAPDTNSLQTLLT